MNSRVMKFLKPTLVYIAVIAGIFLIWFAISALVNSELIFPDPVTTLKLTFEFLGSGKTYLALLFTFLRAAAAFAASFAVALSLSIVYGLFAGLRNAVNKTVTFFRAVPTMSVILLAMLIFDDGFVPVIVAFLVCFPVIYGAFEREITANAALFDVCQTFDVSKKNKTRYVILPVIKKSFLSQCRDTLPFAVKIVIAGEVMSLPKNGLGQQMYIAKVQIDTASVLALTVLALVLCFIVQGAFSLWNKKARSY